MLVNQVVDSACEGSSPPRQRCGGFAASTGGRAHYRRTIARSAATFGYASFALEVLLAHPECAERNSHGCNYQHGRGHECRAAERFSIRTLVHRSDGIDAPGDLHPACRRQESGRSGQRQETFDDSHALGMEKQERSVNDVDGQRLRVLDWDVALRTLESSPGLPPCRKIPLTFDNWTGARNRRSFGILRA
jgi:hypothetical protein